MKRLFLFLILLFPFLCYSTIQIVVIGDSNTSGEFSNETYHSILENNLKSYDVKMMAFGVGGMNSGGGFSILEGLYKSFDKETFHPQFGILALGINDFLHGIKPEDTQLAIEYFINLCLKNNCTPIIGKIDLSYLNISTPDRIKKFNQIFDDVAKKYNIKLFDFMTPELMNDAANHIGDHVHLNSRGHKLIEINLEKVFLESYNEFK